MFRKLCLIAAITGAMMFPLSAVAGHGHGGVTAVTAVMVTAATVTAVMVTAVMVTAVMSRRPRSRP